MIRKTCLLAITLLLSTTAFATTKYHYAKQYEVTVTNITKGQSFTPVLSATHSSKIQFFELGNPASDELAELAEGGNVAPLKEALEASGLAVDSTMTDGLLSPGSSVTFTLNAYPYSRLSVAAMLIPTNDTFMAINKARLPFRGTKTYYAKAYDAGSEMNDELCANIPGPACGGEGGSASEGEGYIYISPGIHGEGDLAASAYDWRDVVAKVEVRRVY